MQCRHTSFNRGTRAPVTLAWSDQSSQSLRRTASMKGRSTLGVAGCSRPGDRLPALSRVPPRRPAPNQHGIIGRVDLMNLGA
jgi:hypothetical protein